jgi:hypothetical protein
MDKQSPIFNKTYDFIKWLLPLTVGFPRSQRFVIASALQQEALRFQGLLIEAVHQADTLARLDEADAELDKLRTHLRLCHDLKLLSHGQYGQAARMVSELGRLLGGWKKTCRAQKAGQGAPAAENVPPAPAEGQAAEQSAAPPPGAEAAAAESAAPAPGSAPPAVQEPLPGI